MIGYEFEHLGVLRFDKIIFEGNYPILFTCVNEKGKLFLCCCCTVRKNFKKWLVTETTPDIILQLLKDEKTIRDSFLNETDEKYSIILENDKYNIIKNDIFDWSEKSYFLPDANEYMEAEEDEFGEEIEYYEQIKSSKKLDYRCNLNFNKVVDETNIHFDITQSQESVSGIINAIEALKIEFQEEVFSSYLQKITINYSKQYISDNLDKLKDITNKLSHFDNELNKSVNISNRIESTQFENNMYNQVYSKEEYIIENVPNNSLNLAA